MAGAVAIDVGFVLGGKTHGGREGLSGVRSLDPAPRATGELGTGGGTTPNRGKTNSNDQTGELESVSNTSKLISRPGPHGVNSDYHIKEAGINVIRGGRAEGVPAVEEGQSGAVLTHGSQRSQEAWCTLSLESNAPRKRLVSPGFGESEENGAALSEGSNSIDITEASKSEKLGDSREEKELLTKFRHVYAGKGGWFGIRSRSSVSARCGIRTTVSIKVTQRRVLKSQDTAMPKTQYEKYKKEIMQKLANTIQSHEEKEKERAVTESMDQGERLNNAITEVNNNMLNDGDLEKGIMLSNNSANITIPASWRLPVGWAGRNKGFFGSDRQRMQRLRHSEKGQVQKRNIHSNIRKQENQIQPVEQIQRLGLGNPSPNPSAIAKLSSGNSLREKSLFTRSWLESSFSNAKAEGNENKDPNLRIGHLFQAPRTQTKDHDVDSSMAAPSAVQTDIIKVQQSVTSPLALETPRTGVATVQSFPRENGADGRRNSKISIRPLGTQKNGPPLSSRKNMNMYSRMSLEAQAALKEMGLANQDASSGDDDNDDDVEHESSYEDERNINDQELLENIIQTKTKAMNVAQGNSNNGNITVHRSKIPNLRNNMREQKQNNSASNNNMNNYRSSDSDSNKLTLISRKTQDKPKLSISGLKASNMNKGETSASSLNNLVKRQTNEAPKTACSSKSSDDNNNKCQNCVMRTGMVLKNNVPNNVPNSAHMRVKSNCSLKSSHSRDSLPKDDKLSQNNVARPRTKLPNIKEISPSGSAAFGHRTENSVSTTPFLGTHRQIPGVGQYKIPDGASKLLIKNWKREQTFEITPVGYDSRFEDIRTKEEDLDETPEEVKQKAIVKCSDWLKKYL